MQCRGNALDCLSEIMNPDEFNAVLWSFYAKNARNSLPWRIPGPDGAFDPYKILVSEIMLQQTQVARVADKYREWLEKYPDIKSLAQAPLADVLSLWLGLGYNRRAKFLHESAKYIYRLGAFPSTLTELVALPGVGVNTAGAILVYAFNKPVVFIETNIRTVFLYHFFAEQNEVSDAVIASLIEATIDTENPREWYWALMDYGSYIKKTKGNYSKYSKHHVKQSKFEGSKRQLRGKILTLLADQKTSSHAAIVKKIADDRVSSVLEDLQKEGLITQRQTHYSLAE